MSSPKSKEGCKCTEWQAKWLSKNLFLLVNKGLPIKYYCMIKLLIILIK
jgi:hypothetical protein